jgi:undecaprenyl pyrophosphate synthase
MCHRVITLWHIQRSQRAHVRNERWAKECGLFFMMMSSLAAKEKLTLMSELKIPLIAVFKFSTRPIHSRQQCGHSSVAIECGEHTLKTLLW